MTTPCTKMNETKYWVGLDVSKQTFDAAVLALDRKAPSVADLPARAFARTCDGVEAFLDWLDVRVENPEKDISRCVMEATGRYSTELAVWMLDRRPSLAPAIECPRRTEAFLRSLGMRNATDKLAARCLAVYGKEREPKAYERPSRQEQELRDVSRHRDALVCQRTAEKNRAGETPLSAFVRNAQRKRLRLLDRDIERAEAEMCEIVSRRPELKNDIALLSTVYGVGFLTAVVVRVELGDLRRFERARQLSAHAGLNPSIRQSGTSVHGKTHMCKNGNPRVRQALYLSAIVAIQGRNDLQRTYARLLENGKSPMAALGAVMRKILCVMRAVLISGKPYDPNWKLRGELIHAQP